MSLDIARRRLLNQRLSGAKFDTPQEVVRWLGAVQSQDYAGAKWALAMRISSITDAQLDQAFADGAILRTHVMRPTWHFVTGGHSLAAEADRAARPRRQRILLPPARAG
ncbi:MAG: crosslink repair DNA glycosylase YcaQ family protein [Anaerolineae bacterium]